MDLIQTDFLDFTVLILGLFLNSVDGYGEQGKWKEELGGLPS